MSLLPVNWVDDWPIIGKVGKDSIGSMVWSAEKPIQYKKVMVPQSTDEFNGKKLLPQWEWNYQPRDDKWSLRDKKGCMRLYAFKPFRNDDLLKAGNTLTQRSYRTPFNEATIKIDISNMADGQKAGLCHFGSPSYSAIGITCINKTKFLELNFKGEMTRSFEISETKLWLRSSWSLDGNSQYSFSKDGVKYFPIGSPYKLSWGSYRGDRVGIFNFNNVSETGYIDVDFFHYDYKVK